MSVAYWTFGWLVCRVACLADEVCIDGCIYIPSGTYRNINRVAERSCFSREPTIQMVEIKSLIETSDIGDEKNGGD